MKTLARITLLLERFANEGHNRACHLTISVQCKLKAPHSLSNPALLLTALCFTGALAQVAEYNFNLY